MIALCFQTGVNTVQEDQLKNTLEIVTDLGKIYTIIVLEVGRVAKLVGKGKVDPANAPFTQFFVLYVQ